MRSKADKNGKSAVLIRKEEVLEGEHHGGSWKVAYADFVTAMMAFFLLMWLLNATTEAQRKGLADYFSPNSVLSHASSGSGLPFGGTTAFAEGTMASDRGAVQVMTGNQAVVDVVEEDDSDLPAQPRPYRNDQKNDQPDRGGFSKPERPPSTAELRAQLEKQEKQAFERAAQQIRDAVSTDPRLTDLAHQLSIDMTPEGLRIQLMDAEREPMFPFGSAVPNERARLLLQKVALVLARMPEEISIAGHTDAAPFAGPDRTNWELSADRANATRRLLVDAGLQENRIRHVTGNAARDPLIASDPLAAANRRIAIVVLRSARPDASKRAEPQ